MLVISTVNCRAEQLHADKGAEGCSSIGEWETEDLGRLERGGI